MKKFIAIVLAMLLVTLSIVAVTAAPKNAAVSIQGINKKPVLDGVITANEYNQKIHTSDYSNDEFLDAYDLDHLVKNDFYAGWTADGVYFAWVAYSDVHNAPTFDGDPDMWRYSNIQFVLTAGNPTTADASKSNEGGIAVANDGKSCKVMYGESPSSIDQWEFVGKRDNTAKTTTYELFIPWSTYGVAAGKVGDQLGFAYALGTQEDFNVKNVMNEWQDVILGGKDYPSAAILTLAAAPAADSTPAGTDDAGKTPTAPVTADFSAIYLLVTMAAGAGVVITSKKRK